ncbi:hypothetical protein Tco_0875207 [Tanacetum coccineum]|uniref:Uncharacterized protein n=1 Tax=Tanacetum coccineum TaxID=301880 RepID=A0ABQ5BRU5_9ASTR
MDDAKDSGSNQNKVLVKANSRKCKKAVLKQQLIGINKLSKESLEKGYDRFQKLLSQLDALGASVSDEDANHKFLRSLPPAWDNIQKTVPSFYQLSQASDKVAFNSQANSNPRSNDSGLAQQFKMVLEWHQINMLEVLDYEEEIRSTRPDQASDGMGFPKEKQNSDWAHLEDYQELNQVVSVTIRGKKEESVGTGSKDVNDIDVQHEEAEENSDVVSSTSRNTAGSEHNQQRRVTPQRTIFYSKNQFEPRKVTEALEDDAGLKLAKRNCCIQASTSMVLLIYPKVLKEKDLLVLLIPDHPTKVTRWIKALYGIPDIKYAYVVVVHVFKKHPKTSRSPMLAIVSFKYLKGKPNLGLWYPRDSPLDLEAFSDSDYGGSNLDRKSTTGGCQFLGQRLISWQCKKQTIVATSTTESNKVASAKCYETIVVVKTKFVDYGFQLHEYQNHMDKESTICILKTLV